MLAKDTNLDYGAVAANPCADALSIGWIATAVQNVGDYVGLVARIDYFGCGGAAYAKRIKILKIRKTRRRRACCLTWPTSRTAATALSRPLFFYTRNKPSGDMKAFIDWVLGAEGQTIVTKVGYFPVN